MPALLTPEEEREIDALLAKLDALSKIRAARIAAQNAGVKVTLAVDWESFRRDLSLANRSIDAMPGGPDHGA